MMKFLDKLLPDFLKKWNHDLLIHYPSIWATRIHMVVVLGLMFSLLLLGLGFAVPMNYWEFNGTMWYVSFVVIVSFLVGIVWLIYLFRFNPFKRFGENNATRKTAMDLLVFLLYMKVGFIFCFWPFIMPAVETYRIYSQISPEEVVTDINTLNLKISTLEFDTSIMEFRRDTVVFLSKAAYDKRNTDLESVSDDEVIIENNISSYSYYSVDEKKVVLSTADSTEKINDSIHVLLEAPPLEFISEAQLSEVSKVDQIEAYELYHLARIASSKGIDSKQYFKDIVSLLRKYDRNWSDFDVYQKKYRKDMHVEQFNDLFSKFDFHQVNDKIGNISSIMTRWLPSKLWMYFHVVVCLSIGMSLLVYIYRHSTVRTFFLTFLVGFLLYVLTALVFVISRWHDEGMIWMICLAYFLLFAGLGVSNLWSTKRSLIKGIALNIFLLTVIFLPILLTLLYYDYLEKKYWNLSYSSEEYQRLFGDKDIHLLLSGWGGVLLLLVAIEFCFKRLYIKWYASPQE